jgi:hypothetical protein
MASARYECSVICGWEGQASSCVEVALSRSFELRPSRECACWAPSSILGPAWLKAIRYANELSYKDSKISSEKRSELSESGIGGVFLVQLSLV